MLFILISIVCNIIVSVLLKLAKRYYIDIPQAVTWNYATAAILTYTFLKPDITAIQYQGLSFGIYGTLAILLPSLFLVIAASVKINGIVRTDVAQRISLFIPILSAFLLFNESLSIPKVIGITLGFAAILCSIPWGKNQKSNSDKKGWIYLLVVFVGMGLIDILFKQVASLGSIPYSSSLLIIYIFAFLFSIISLFVMIRLKKVRFAKRHIVSGALLGLFNFGNILFYLKAHQALMDRPSLVFSAMNIGVIIAGALVGIWLFNEKLSKLNKVGFVLALISILVITLY